MPALDYSLSTMCMYNTDRVNVARSSTQEEAGTRHAVVERISTPQSRLLAA